jgi:hypothetical protein
MPTMKRAFASLTAAMLLVPLAGCIYVKTHSTIEPIHMTLDVNLKVQLQEELADVFGDIDAASATVSTPAPTP